MIKVKVDSEGNRLDIPNNPEIPQVFAASLFNANVSEKWFWETGEEYQEYQNSLKPIKVIIEDGKISQMGIYINSEIVLPQNIINTFPELYAFQGASVEVENNEVVSAIPSEAMVALFRANKCDEIDNKTQDIIFRGFSYNNIRFSLSITAQINWSNIPHLPDFLFPIPIQGQDNSVYQLQLAEKMNFYLSAVSGKNTPLQQGTALKAQVNALTDLNEIKNFVDPRE